jgi:hypothetical protein
LFLFSVFLNLFIYLFERRSFRSVRLVFLIDSYGSFFFAIHVNILELALRENKLLHCAGARPGPGSERDYGIGDREGVLTFFDDVELEYPRLAVDWDSIRTTILSEDFNLPFGDNRAVGDL